ncbi:hypothetical protein N9C10_03625 [Flavobacteriaceae bacterium]|nr:hypothetical protein [Flavobacteriaceae bacterium]
MSRGRIQLASVGIQDEFLTGDPQITYFLKNFKRHTKFALETLQSGFIKEANSFGQLNECFIPRKGDLIRNMYVKANLSSFGYPLIETTIAISGTNTNTFEINSTAETSNITPGCYFAGNQGGTDYSFEKDNIKVTAYDDTTNIVTVDQNVTVVATEPAQFLQPVGYTDSIGHALIEHADLIIGGQTVERITGEYMELNSDVAVSDSQQQGLKLLVGKTGLKTGLGPAAPLSQAGVTKDYYGAYPRIFMIPLPFYFFRHDSLSIPLSAIDKQEVQVRIKFRNWENLIVNINSNPYSFEQLETTPVMENLTLVTEYVYLSDDELNYFRKTSIDYIISQLQVSRFKLDANLTSKQVLLQFLNPVKELFFVIQNNNFVESNVVTGNDWFNFSNEENFRAPLYEQLDNLRLDFNGQTIIPSEVADAVYLRGIQPLLCHTRGPNRRFYLYSFALDPENDLPTGQVNMSRITNKLLDINTTANTQDRTISVYAVNFNVLRVQNGLAGVIFNFNSD